LPLHQAARFVLTSGQGVAIIQDLARLCFRETIKENRTSSKMRSPSNSNIRVLAARTFLGGMRDNVVRVVWQPFVLGLGASMPFLGFLESLGGLGGIVPTLVQPLSGWLSDYLGRKVFVLCSSVLTIVALSIYVLAKVTDNWHLLIPGVAILGLAAASRPAEDSMTAESAGVTGRAMAYSLVMLSSALSGVFAPLLGGFVADRWDYIIAFLIGLALDVLALSLVAGLLKETLVSQSRRPLAFGQLKELFRGILVPPDKLRGFYIAMALDAFAWGTGWGILYGLLSEAHHFTASQLGIMSCLSSVGWAIFQMPVGKLVQRYGCVKSMILSEAGGVILTVGWLHATTFQTFALLQILFGFTIATWLPATMTWMANSVPREKMAEGMGRLNAFRGLVGFPAPYIGGLLYEAFGFRGPITVNLIGALTVAILMALLVHEPTMD
jgi:DHA1 family bicyclomycin/chloramphenicol resistance-like MFS transporter